MRAIYDVGGTLDFALTLPDDKARRKSGRVFLDDFCADRNLPLFKFPNINSEASIALLRDRRPDWLFVVGWSQVAGRDVLSAPRLGTIGMHPTLLPEGRGRAAIPWAILKGLTDTGVTMFVLDEGVDTGDVIAQMKVPIAFDETATSLYARLAAEHVALIKRTWSQLKAGSVVRRPQDHQRATIWPARTPGDGRLHSGLCVSEAERLVRATTRPYPGAFITLGPAHKTIRVWAGKPSVSAQPPHGALRLQFADGSYDALVWSEDHSTIE